MSNFYLEQSQSVHNRIRVKPIDIPRYNASMFLHYMLTLKEENRNNVIIKDIITIIWSPRN